MTHDDTLSTTGSPSEGRSSVEPLAAQVISVLCEQQTTNAAGVRLFALDYLVRTVLSRGGFDAVLVLDELRGYRLTPDAIIDLYIPQAALRLGDMWLSSDIDFAEVTVGALRLQALLGEASNGLIWIGQASKSTLHALVVVPEGEQHFLGSSVVAAQLRRSGCDVSLAICETQKQIVARVVQNKPDMVLLSCARLAGLKPIIAIVKKIRASVDHAPVLALGGPLRGNAAGIKEQAGVDLVTSIPADVVKFCAKRKEALGPK